MNNTKMRKFSTKQLVATSMMIAITVIFAVTPIGMIRLPLVSITLAHVPAIITAIVFGLYEGIFTALAFGITSLILAVISPSSILDPFFVNPLISILPRLLIPVTTWLIYNGLSKHFNSSKLRTPIIAASVIIGNLTNTFGVYTMLYIIYAKQIMEKSGTPALTLIIGAISTTTLIKCIAIAIIAVPVILTLQKVIGRNTK